jgi:cysteinyl-tRNA synthetase
MSTIQQLKNFIRHGKQARANQDAPQQSAAPSAAHKNMPAISEPVMHGINATAAAPTAPQPIPGVVSVADADAQNRAAQAGNLAAHAVDEQQEQEQAEGITPDQKKSKKRIDEDEIARLVAEENESRAKFTRYPGLERWILVEKMGDGAFSNVYKARDTLGEHGEVAIKVVRKYEMNSMQVSWATCRRRSSLVYIPLSVVCLHL